MAERSEVIDLLKTYHLMRFEACVHFYVVTHEKIPKAAETWKKRAFDFFDRDLSYSGLEAGEYWCKCVLSFLQENPGFIGMNFENSLSAARRSISCAVFERASREEDWISRHNSKFYAPMAYRILEKVFRGDVKKLCEIVFKFPWSNDFSADTQKILNDFGRAQKEIMDELSTGGRLAQGRLGGASYYASIPRFCWPMQLVVGEKAKSRVAFGPYGNPHVDQIWYDVVLTKAPTHGVDKLDATATAPDREGERIRVAGGSCLAPELGADAGRSMDSPFLRSLEEKQTDVAPNQPDQVLEHGPRMRLAIEAWEKELERAGGQSAKLPLIKIMQERTGIGRTTLSNAKQFVINQSKASNGSIGQRNS